MKVGIDLGTTYSLVSRLDAEGNAVLIPDHGEPDVFHTPSAVNIGFGCAFVGRMAESLAETDPELPILRFFKRLMGQHDPVFFDESGSAWYPEAVSSLILKKLRFDAESQLGTPVKSAVISVPAHFSDPQRRAVLAAAALADVPVLGLVEEPVAAALHYGVTAGAKDEILLVYDFGGGTFDATVLSADPTGFSVLAKTGITDLGGKELDEKVGTMILAQFERARGRALHMGARTLLELRRVSEELKIEICTPGRTHVRQLVLLGGQAVEVEITRTDFERAIQEYMQRAEAEMMLCLKEAGLRPADVTRLLLVGGSALIPLIETRMHQVFCRPGQQVLYHEPSKAIAFGAALHASQLAGDADRFQLPPELKGVSGYSVGVRTVDPSTGRVVIDTVIKKNMPLPSKARKAYYTTRPNQERIVLDFVQFRDSGEALISLGKLVVGPLSAPRPNYPVEVATEYREDGTISVEAYDAQTGIELKQVFGHDADGGTRHLASQRSLVRGTVINNLIS